MDFDAAADELYGVLPGEFTARRNALSKQAADDGDPGLAQQIRGLTKPSLAAWVTNILVRNHRSEVDTLLKLGDSLRDATARLSRDDLSALSKQQREVVAGLVKLATADAADAGQQVSATVARTVEQTLRAALGDPDSGELLAGGRLAEPLQYIGFPCGIQTVSATPSNRPASKPDTKKAVAQAAKAESREALAQAQRGRDAAADELAEAGRKVELIAGHLEEVKRRVTELSGQLREAERDQRAATKSRDQAQEAVATAQQRLDDLSARG